MNIVIKTVIVVFCWQRFSPSPLGPAKSMVSPTNFIPRSKGVHDNRRHKYHLLPLSAEHQTNNPNSTNEAMCLPLSLCPREICEDTSPVRSYNPASKSKKKIVETFTAGFILIRGRYTELWFLALSPHSFSSCAIFLCTCAPVCTSVFLLQKALILQTSAQGY